MSFLLAVYLTVAVLTFMVLIEDDVQRWGSVTARHAAKVAFLALAWVFILVGYCYLRWFASARVKAKWGVL